MRKSILRTLQSKSGLIFFAILAIYNLLLGVYLKDFFVLSPMLLTFYLLSALPPLLFVIRIRSAPTRAIVYIVLFVTLLTSALSVALCRRILPMITLIKVFALTFPICLPHSAAVRTFLAMPLTEYPMGTAPFSTPGTVCTMTDIGGTWM